jgi:hypothetical protein
MKPNTRAYYEYTHLTGERLALALKGKTQLKGALVHFQLELRTPALALEAEAIF